MHHPSEQVGAKRCRSELPPYVNPKTGKARKAERAVFAWLNADSCAETATPPPHAERLSLNPFIDAFFNVAGVRVDQAATAWLMPDGTAWVVRSRSDEPEGAKRGLSPSPSKTPPTGSDMMRITVVDLDLAVNEINRVAGTPLETWTRRDGKLTPNAFNYHLSGAYGGYSLHQHGESGSGGRDVFQIGHVPKRELHGLLRAYRAGLEAVTA
jgi:hypothetical protein